MEVDQRQFQNKIQDLISYNFGESSRILFFYWKKSSFFLEEEVT